MKKEHEIRDMYAYWRDLAPARATEHGSDHQGATTWLTASFTNKLADQPHEQRTSTDLASIFSMLCSELIA
jgi:hypothetical protein